ncbi:hypothetical protein BH23GEM8_BH23GEM8_04280 [soil metagenome]
MLRNRMVHFVAAFAIVGLVACGGSETETTVSSDTSLVTQPTTETMEVEVAGQDTFMVERRTETEVTVDTTRVDGRDTIRRRP